MFGTSSYLDKSMNGIKTLSDGSGALIQNGNATFNTINVDTITSSNLTDCNLINCTTNDPTSPQSVANKEYVDDNFVDRTNNLTQSINGVKTFNSIPLCSSTASLNNQMVNFFTLNNQGFTTLPLVQSNNNIWIGSNTYNTSLPTSTITAINNNEFVNFFTLNNQSFVKPSFNNAWTSTNSFNSFLPTSTITAINNNELVNFFTLNNQSFVKPSFNNVWTGTNSFNNSIPTTNITAINNNELVNFTCLNSQGFTTLGLVQNNANVWTNSNTFNAQLPTSTITAINNNEFVNFFTLNNQSFVKPSSNNAWTGTNSFNSFIPTTNITAVTSNDIVNFTCLNAQSFVKPSFNNVWLGSNSFNAQLPTSLITAFNNNELVNFFTLNAQSFVKPSFANVWTGSNTFNAQLPTSTATPSNPSDFTTKAYVDGMPVHQILNSTNIWTGTNTFNTNLPTSTATPSSPSQLTTKAYVDGMPVHGILGSSNVWTGTNTFNTHLPTSTATPSNPSDFTTKAYVDGMPVHGILGGNNIWTGTNNFTTNIPTTTNQATSTTQLVNFTCLNAQSFVKPSFNNVWTGTNSFNTSIPTTNITALTTNDIVNFTCLNAQSFVKPSFNNVWTGTNSFNTSIPTTNITALTTNDIVNFTCLNAQSFVKPSFNNVWLGSNTFNSQLPTSTIIPLNGVDLVNKTYTDSQFMFKNGSVTESITGVKTFSNNCIFSSSLLLKNKKQLNEIQNITSDTTVVLSFPLQETNIIRTITPTLTSLTITLPAVTANEQGLLFNFFKFRNNLNVTLTSTSPIFTLYDTSNIVYTNTNLLSSDKRMTTLMCGFSGTLNYWIEVSNYSTFDRDYNNTIYPRLSIGNAFTNTNTFNAQTTFNNTTPICSVATPTANDHLTRKDYVDTNFMFKSGAVAESIGGVKTFLNRVNCSGGTALVVAGLAQFNGNTEFYSTTYFVNNPPISYIAPTSPDHLTNKNYVDSMPVHQILNSTNAWTGFNSFNVNLPTTTKTTFALNEFVTRNYVDSMPVHGILGSNNIWSGTNDFTTSIPTTTNQATSTTQLVNFNCLNAQSFVKPSFTNNWTATNNFSSNINCSSSINFTDIGNFSSILATIQQNSATLNIENPSLGSTIRLKTRPSVGAVQNSLTLNTASCDILSPTLNLTGASPISILTPNNLNGTINLFNNLTTGGTININSSSGVNIINGSVTINNDLISNAQATFSDYIITNTGLKWVDVTPSTNYVESRVLGTALGFIPSFNLNSYEFYTNDSLGTPHIPVTITDASTTFNHQLICNNGAVFNTTLPTSTINASNANELVNYSTLTGQGFTTLPLVRSSTNTFTGFNTFSSGLTIRSTLLLKDVTNVLQGSIDLILGGLLNISCSVNSGKIILSTHDSTGNSYNRLSVDENEVNITAPLTLSVDYSYYNPANFNSTRLGYSMSNTGSTISPLTNNTAVNSGQLNIPAGSWNISYTATITVITANLNTLTSLEVYVADSFNNDLNIIGINVLNYYKISTVPLGQKMRISGSGNYISYTNVSTQLNLRLLPLFTAGSGGLNFQGKISATRNA